MSKLALAFLQASFGTPEIDTDNGIIRGVKIMEVGCTAHFSDTAGNVRSVKITPAHVNALMAHAGNRALPIHATHEWLQYEGKPDADSKEMGARIGALKAFRKDDKGDLIADAFFKDGQARQDIMWSAKHNPEDTMFSAVFNFKKDDPDCMPTNFRAGDVVPFGAATTALFSAVNPNDNMADTDTDFITKLSAALKDPTIHAAVKAMVKECEPADDDTSTADMEEAAGVTKDDKKDSDKQAPAMMRRFLPIIRALGRRTKAVATDEAVLLAKVDIRAKAEATAALGNNTLLRQREDDAKKPTAVAKFNGLVKELVDKGIKPNAAAVAVLRAHPGISDEMNVERGIFKAA